MHIVIAFAILSFPANGQQPSVTCSASALPHVVRAEGLTELIGDLILICTGGTATAYGAPVPVADVVITTNAPITSKRLVDNSNNWSEALLALDDPAPASQTYCAAAGGLCTNYGNGSGLPVQTAGPISVGGVNRINANVFQGQITGSNSLLFAGIPIDAPAQSGSRIIRITNVRVNANSLGAAPGGPPITVTAMVAITGANVTGVNNATQTASFTQKGLAFSMTAGALTANPFSAVGLPQCASQDKTVIGTLNYKENFATAFKRSGAGDNDNVFGSGAISGYVTESGFQPSGYPQPLDTRGDPNTAGDAGSGTRLKVRFDNVPNGVTLWVSLYSGHTASKPVSGEYFAATGGGEAGAFADASTADAPWLKIVPSGGTATVVWENFEAGQSAQHLAISNFQFVVAVSYGANVPGPGLITASASYAPVSAVTLAATGPLPRFADMSTASNVLAITQCSGEVTFAGIRQTIQQLAGSGKIGNAGVARSLLAHLSAAEDALSRGGNKAARNILNAMANEVRAQSGKHIEAGAAQALLEAIGALAAGIAP